MMPNEKYESINFFNVLNILGAKDKRQVLRYNPQNKISYLCSIAMNLHTF